MTTKPNYQLKETEQIKTFKTQVDERKEDERVHAEFIRAALLDALLYAPEKWPDQKLEELEELHTGRVEEETSRVPDEFLATYRFATRHAKAAVRNLQEDFGPESDTDLVSLVF